MGRSDKRGKRFKLTVMDTYIRVLKVNHFLQERQPLTVPRTDPELVEFLRDELDDCSIDCERLKRYRNDWNAGRLSQGNPPNFISKEWTE